MNAWGGESYSGLRDETDLAPAPRHTRSAPARLRPSSARASWKSGEASPSQADCEGADSAEHLEACAGRSDAWAGVAVDVVDDLAGICQNWKSRTLKSKKDRTEVLTSLFTTYTTCPPPTRVLHSSIRPRLLLSVISSHCSLPPPPLPPQLQRSSEFFSSIFLSEGHEGRNSFISSNQPQIAGRPTSVNFDLPHYSLHSFSS